MSFSARDLRPGKDVFASDGTYVGTVVWVTSRPVNPAHRSEGEERGSENEGPRPGFSGEGLGPMPTASLGNSGPASQSPSTKYATSMTMAARAPSELVVLRLLTALNWSMLRPRLRRIPVGLVQAVSHERIVLNAEPGLDHAT